MTAVIQELAAVWRPNGVTVVSYEDDGKVDGQMRVALILTQSPPPSADRGTLGWIGFLQTGPPVPVSFVSLPATRAVIETASFRGFSVLELPPRLRERLFARALGRAAAHELGHYLLSTRLHSARGLMQSRFSAQQWVDDDDSAFRLRRADLAGLAARLRSARASLP